MTFDFIIIFNLLISVFCFVTSLYLFLRGLKNHLLIFYLFGLYFFFISMNQIFLYLYSIQSFPISDNSKYILLITISLGFLSIIPILISTKLINKELNRNILFSELFFFVLCLFGLVFFFQDNVILFNSQMQMYTPNYLNLLLIVFIIFPIICLINVQKADKPSSISPENFRLFIILGLILTVARFFSSSIITFGSNTINFSFMNIFILLFIIQIFLVVHSLPSKPTGSLNFNKFFSQAN